MRDPARIEPMLELLRTIWTRDPDLRLGQIIGNAAGPDVGTDPYYIEDDVIAARLARLAE